MQIDYRWERLDDPAGALLVGRFGEEMAALYPTFTNDHPGAPSSTAADLAPPHGGFVVAYTNGEPIGCGGLKRIDDAAVEVKRLYVAVDSRGRGVAAGLLATLEAAARELGYVRVRLDTGPSQPHALALFRSAGYREIGDYNGNSFAAYWLEKEL